MNQEAIKKIKILLKNFTEMHFRWDKCILFLKKIMLTNCYFLINDAIMKLCYIKQSLKLVEDWFLMKKQWII